jgi:hypothetical protein
VFDVVFGIVFCFFEQSSRFQPVKAGGWGPTFTTWIVVVFDVVSCLILKIITVIITVIITIIDKGTHTKKK